jgi:hypothetical protein
MATARANSREDPVADVEKPAKTPDGNGQKVRETAKNRLFDAYFDLFLRLEAGSGRGAAARLCGAPPFRDKTAEGWGTRLL